MRTEAIGGSDTTSSSPSGVPEEGLSRFSATGITACVPATRSKPEGEVYFEPLPTESSVGRSGRQSPYDFYAKVRGNESLDRLSSFLAEPPPRPGQTPPASKGNPLFSATFAELEFSE